MALNRGPEELEHLAKRVKKEAPTEPSRAVFIAGVGPNVMYFDLCKVANQFGAIDLIKINPAKKYAFINFVDQVSAEKFHAAAQAQPLVVASNTLKVSWARCEPLDQETLQAVQNGATRNLYISSAGSLPEETIAAAFARFGEIENITQIPQKNIAFVNLTSLKSAIAAQRASAENTLEISGRKLKVGFAKEGVAGRDPRHRPPLATPPAPASLPGIVPVSRAVYLANLPDDITFNDLCKLGNRYGAIEQIAVNAEKKTAFINFLDSNAAAALFSAAQTTPIVLHNKPIRINWAKSQPIRSDILDEVRKGATRNLYLGNIPESVSEEQLQELFAKYGPIDAIIIKRNKAIAFVNLTSIRAALTAKAEMQANPPVFEGVPVKINFAKESVRTGPGFVPSQPPSPGHPQQQQQQQIQAPSFEQFNAPQSWPIGPY